MTSIAVQSNPLDRNGGRPRSSRIAIALAASALLLLSVLPATALAKRTLAASDRPTIVLVHGAWAGPSGWAQVAAALQKDGYRTVTPALDLASITGDADIVAATLDGIPGKKILVGHSYGGIVISNAAFGRSDVLGLVFTAAFVPDEGESILSLGTNAAVNTSPSASEPAERGDLEMHASAVRMADQESSCRGYRRESLPRMCGPSRDQG